MFDSAIGPATGRRTRSFASALYAALVCSVIYPISADGAEFSMVDVVSSEAQAGPEFALDTSSGDLPLARASAVLSRVKPDRTVRGAREVKLYKELAGSVVLIVTKDGLGSGSLIDDKGTILTNYHVVQGFREVGVIFKPIDATNSGNTAAKPDVRPGKVVKVDQVADLALVRVATYPADRPPILLGERGDVTIGDDVHAIGHPKGETWTYTKGLVSQIRDGYAWGDSTKRDATMNRANVIQTQTPISPGNSGGPLLSNDGKLVGVNSFIYGATAAQNLNFAVSVEEVHRFVSMKGDRISRPQTEPSKSPGPERAPCQIKVLFKGLDKDGSAELTSLDTNCDGKMDAQSRRPVDRTKAALFLLDRNFDGKVDEIWFDTQRNGKWVYSIIDTDFDGVFDLRCDLKEGTLERTRCEKYVAEAPKTRPTSAK
jgi:S1-C subfamily serine protease